MAKAWINDVRDMLKEYKNIENSIINMEQELEMLGSILDPKGFKTTSFSSGGSDYNLQEEKIFNYMFKTKNLEIQLKVNKYYYSMLSKAFEILNKEEMTMIEECYIKNRSVKRVAAEMNYDDSNIYKILNKAIRKIIRFCYGYQNF